MSPTPDLRPQRARICAANATIVLLEDGDLEAQKAWQTRFELDAHGVTRVAIVSGAAEPAAPAPAATAQPAACDRRPQFVSTWIV